MDNNIVTMTESITQKIGGEIIMENINTSLVANAESSMYDHCDYLEIINPKQKEIKSYDSTSLVQIKVLTDKYNKEMLYDKTLDYRIDNFTQELNTDIRSSEEIYLKPTEQFLQELSNKGVPEDIISKMKKFTDKEFKKPEDFVADLEKEVEVSNYKSQILQYAKESQLSEIKIRIQEIQDLLKDYYIEFNKHEKAINVNLAIRMLKMGKLLNSIKKLIYQLGDITWDAWVKRNLQFMNERTMQTYMQLARIKNVEKHLILGKERILHIDKVIKANIQDDCDPIATFLKRHKITANEDTPFEEFKNIIDTAIVIDKAQSKKINTKLDYEAVRVLIEIGFQFTNSEYSELKIVEDASGDPNKVLNSWVLSRGKQKAEDKKNKTPDFHLLGSRMKQTVDFLLKNKEIKDIEPKEVQEVIDLLEKLKEHLKK